jgi:hypothetical protein
VRADKRLLAIRRALEAAHPGTPIDFYLEPAKSLWQQLTTEEEKEEEVGSKPAPPQKSKKRP